MNCLPTIQFDYDLWYVEGGMYNLAIALTKLAEELGVGLHLGQEVCRIATASDSVTRVVLSDSSEHEADAVVCNMEAVPAYKRLLDEDERFMRKLEKFEPACSGLVIDLGLDITYPELAHHNFFYSSNQEEHFRSVFEDRQLPSDPTLYVVAAGRTDPGVAPPGGDVLKVLPHIPYIDEENPVAEDRYVELKDRVIRKLERMGLSGLRDHIVVEHLWTPRDIERRYYSNKGSIYGVVSDRFKNLAFKVPKRSSRYRNLFFVGGSVNPGGGMPMVALCGQRVAEAVGEAMRG
jgi:diapolycopene oxygenase